MQVDFSQNISIVIIAILVAWAFLFWVVRGRKNMRWVLVLRAFTVLVIILLIGKPNIILNSNDAISSRHIVIVDNSSSVGDSENHEKIWTQFQQALNEKMDSSMIEVIPLTLQKKIILLIKNYLISVKKKRI